MRALPKGGKEAVCAVLLLISLYGGWTAQAQGGFALSGSFSAQQFELAQGASLKALDVYIVVFNNTRGDLNVRMIPQTPLGVKLLVSEDDFPLQAGAQKRVEVGIEVTSDAAPGEYKVSITAEPYRKDATGIQIVGAAGQSATLVVVGEAARVTARVVNPAGEQIPGMVRLFKLVGSNRYEVAYSETGEIQATVAPGSYAAMAYMGGESLAEESFAVAANAEKSIALTAKTVYFEGFGVVPNYRTGTQELAFAQVVYTLKNLYKPVAEAKVVLQVSFNGAPLDQVPLATLSPLEMGRVGLSYNYIPAEVRKSGTYGFKLALYLEGKPYAATPEELLTVGKPLGTPTSTVPPAVNWKLIGGSLAVVAVILAAAFVLVQSRTRAKRKG